MQKAAHRIKHRVVHHPRARARSNSHRGHHAHHYFDLSGRLNNLKDSLSTLTENVTDTTSKLWDRSIKSVKSETKALPKNLNRFVTKNPYKAIGITALSVLFLGYFFRSKK